MTQPTVQWRATRRSLRVRLEPTIAMQRSGIATTSQTRRIAFAMPDTRPTETLATTQTSASLRHTIARPKRLASTRMVLSPALATPGGLAPETAVSTLTNARWGCTTATLMPHAQTRPVLSRARVRLVLSEMGCHVHFRAIASAGTTVPSPQRVRPPILRTRVRAMPGTRVVVSLVRRSTNATCAFTTAPRFWLLA
jgi:hypothetical protein